MLRRTRRAGKTCVVQCWTCGADASATCRFCGRATCKEHAKTKSFLFETWDDAGTLRALAVEDAIHCGVCKPKAAPIDAEFLKRGHR